MARDFRSYYSLGLRPPRGDGEAHEVEVRIRRKGARVRHRRTMRPQEADEEAAARTRNGYVDN